ncbi:NHL repeat-containing protein [Variovorax sp. OK605]|nr:NHL repeat-containing protein [Variovorax sp. OK605]
MFSSRMSFQVRCGAVAGAILVLASCGGGGGGGGSGFLPIVVPPAAPAPAPVVTHTVGGSVTGLTGSLVLQNNAGDDLKLSADGKFSFATALVEGTAYEVSVRAQPLWQFCTVTKGNGNAAADVADVAVACSAAVAQVSTFAGTAGTVGAADGNGAAASFSAPAGVALAKSGGLLVTDGISGLLRKISSARDVAFFAGGGGAPTSQDGNGSAATFDGPIGVAMDAAGNSYVADSSGNRIRKISPAGEVTTFAGNGTASSLDGYRTAATFNAPVSVAVDAAGNVYVAEVVAAVIRKITPDGDVSTFAGKAGMSGFAEGTGDNARFNQPFGLALDVAGNLYVADAANSRIRKITPDRVVSTFAGTGLIGSADGPRNSATFAFPAALALDVDGNVYVAEPGSSVLRRITLAGEVSTLAGVAFQTGAQDGIGKAARFGQPLGIAVDAGGALYVADTQNSVIRKVEPVRAP